MFVGAFFCRAKGGRLSLKDDPTDLEELTAWAAIILVGALVVVVVGLLVLLVYVV